MKRFLNPVALGLMLGLAATAQAQNWPVYGGDTGNTRYSASSNQVPPSRSAGAGAAKAYFRSVEP